MKIAIIKKIIKAINVILPAKRRIRVPVDEIYFEKGMYKELVPDPFNLSR
jgi:hypothetical protein